MWEETSPYHNVEYNIDEDIESEVSLNSTITRLVCCMVIIIYVLNIFAEKEWPNSDVCWLRCLQLAAFPQVVL